MFVNVPSKPVPSLARRFSAPVIVKFDYSEAQLTQLMAHDSDPFTRWEAGQRLATGILLHGIEAKRGGKPFEAPRAFVDAFARVLRDPLQDPAFAAEALSLPSETYLAEQMAGQPVARTPVAEAGSETNVTIRLAATAADVMCVVFGMLDIGNLLIRCSGLFTRSEHFGALSSPMHRLVVTLPMPAQPPCASPPRLYGR